MAAYLPKIATQGRPILVVDGFAGPGKFQDREPGSPLILAQQIRTALRRRRPLPVEVRLLAIERDQELARELSYVLSYFSFAETRYGDFNDYIQDIESAARTHSVFLYLDPFTVEGLNWESLDRIFRQVACGTSVEVLLNFNAVSFVRRALGALKKEAPEPDPGREDMEPIDAEFVDFPSVARLDMVVGGQWWRDIIEAESSFEAAVQNLAERYCRALSDRFAQVCMHAVKALPQHTVPKYYLVFASRHPDAFRLMNDEMVKSRDTLAELAAPKEPVLFETRSLDLVPNLCELPQIVLDQAEGRLERGNLITLVIRANFGKFSTGQIKRAIRELLKAGRLRSATGKVRINDNVYVWRNDDT